MTLDPKCKIGAEAKAIHEMMQDPTKLDARWELVRAKIDRTNQRDAKIARGEGRTQCTPRTVHLPSVHC